VGKPPLLNSTVLIDRYKRMSFKHFLILDM